MSFDPTITTADALVAIGYAGSLAWFAIKQRDALRSTAEAAGMAIEKLKGECDHKAALSVQRMGFIERKVADDASRNESHWSEVKQALTDMQENFTSALTRLMDKLDNKADKPGA